jgi:hypothetical protein
MSATLNRVICVPDLLAGMADRFRSCRGRGVIAEPGGALMPISAIPGYPSFIEELGYALTDGETLTRWVAGRRRP